jgi:hypothetical protein
VQAASAVGAAKTTLSVTPTANVTVGNRLVVEVGVWNSTGATASAVKDSAGDAFTEITHFTASDGTELSLWTAPITHGPGQPTITATATGSADVGIAALEYSGLSSVNDASIVDQSAHATGKTSSAVAVGSGSTMATTASGELALGLYADSGFASKLAGGPGYSTRANVSPNGNMQLLVEDASVGAGANPAASVTTGANTIWLMATVVLKHG